MRYQFLIKHFIQLKHLFICYLNTMQNDLLWIKLFFYLSWLFIYW